ncbi:MAG: SHOCT domain-containing protein [Smithella sp.]|nr:SHOCT domain-containing protein [Smithella sp.]
MLLRSVSNTIKKLLDNGAITQKEFNREKGKILSDK